MTNPQTTKPNDNTRAELAKKFQRMPNTKFSGPDVAYLITHLVINDEVEGHA